MRIEEPIVLLAVAGCLAMIGLALVFPLSRQWLELTGERHPAAISILSGVVLGVGLTGGQVGILGWRAWPLALPAGIIVAVLYTAFRVTVERRRRIADD